MAVKNDLVQFFFHGGFKDREYSGLEIESSKDVECNKRNDTGKELLDIEIFASHSTS